MRRRSKAKLLAFLTNPVQSMLRRRFLLGPCLLACVVLLAPPASASPENADDGCLQDEVCRSHYERAVALFEQSHYDTALSEFQAAYAQRQMPWLVRFRC